MNQHQAAFLVQARSDWDMYEFLTGLKPSKAACHRFHYLQMAVEKLAKASLWGAGSPPSPSHAVVVGFLRKLREDPRVHAALQFEGRRAQFRRSIDSLLPIAARIERLTPDLAEEGPNLEYPWPRSAPRTAPVEYDFPLTDELNADHGRKFLELMSRLFQTADIWC